MTQRLATCHCGQLRVCCEGEPVRVSVCHCLDCQKRSGSVFATQARWPEGRVEIIGNFTEWCDIKDDGGTCTFRFCSVCGATVAFFNDGMPDLVAIPVGAFADPLFPIPEYSVFESRKHRWVHVVGGTIAHFD